MQNLSLETVYCQNNSISRSIRIVWQWWPLHCTDQSSNKSWSPWTSYSVLQIHFNVSSFWMVWFFVFSSLFKLFLTFQNSIGRPTAVTTATTKSLTKSDFLFCTSRWHTFKSEPSSWCCFRHLAHLTSFHENFLKNVVF